MKALRIILFGIPTCIAWALFILLYLITCGKRDAIELTDKLKEAL